MVAVHEVSLQPHCVCECVSECVCVCVRVCMCMIANPLRAPNHSFSYVVRGNY